MDQPDSTSVECKPCHLDSGQEREEQIPALSKNQLKKQQRKERWAETKKERRKKEKEKIKERKRKEMDERIARGLDKNLPAIKRRKMSDPGASDIRVAIDCAYDDYMNEHDLKKLLKQIQRCYAENRKSCKPLQLYISSLTGKTKELADVLIQGYQNWDVHIRAESPDKAFGAESIVYLAAESNHVLKELDPEKVYIIGGLVDHNHHKGICFKKIREMGWSHAQLPIGDFVKLNSRKVLAVNHVYEIILAFIQLGSWKDAFFQVLPSRKVDSYVPEIQPENNSASELKPPQAVPERQSENNSASERSSSSQDISVCKDSGQSENSSASEIFNQEITRSSQDISGCEVTEQSPNTCASELLKQSDVELAEQSQNGSGRELQEQLDYPSAGEDASKESQGNSTTENPKKLEEG